MIRTLFFACMFVLTVTAQPRFPQHSPRMPVVQLPPIENHITNLSGSIAGRPMPSRPGAPPIHVIGGWLGGGWAGGGWYPQPQVQPTPLLFVNQQNTAPPPAPILVVNPDYKPEVARPVLREYSNISNPYENFTPNAPKVFLIALKDGTLRQAVAFWAENEKFHFVQPGHKQDSVPLSNLDRESTKRFNFERGLEIKLPE
ncbi:MAG: hypothetical protein ACKV2U_04715 [Bryobacteraceae bacterium]